MIESDKNFEPDDNNTKISREKIKIQYIWYISCFLCIYIGSFLIPGIILLAFLIFLFIPNILLAPTLYSLWFELHSLITFILWPLVIIGCYIIHLVFLGLVTRWIWRLSEKISPTEDGIIPRNVNSKRLNMYHIRSFIIKYGKNAFSKGPFPWLSNWFFNSVGASIIGKGTVIEETTTADRNLEIGKDSYFGVNSVLTSHLVEGIFGNVNQFRIKIGDNVTAGGWNCFGPGTIINSDSYLLPSASGGKHFLIKGKSYYFGQPLKKIFKRNINDYLNISQEDLKKND